VPFLVFELDKSIEDGAQVLALIEEVARQDQAPPTAPAGEP
jgi:ribosome-binding factor A